MPAKPQVYSADRPVKVLVMSVMFFVQPVTHQFIGPISICGRGLFVLSFSSLKIYNFSRSDICSIYFPTLLRVQLFDFRDALTPNTMMPKGLACYLL